MQAWFTVDSPVSFDEFAEVAHQGGYPHARLLRQLHVLVVDDDLMQAEALAELLSYQQQLTSRAVESGDAAIDYVARRRPDVVILDCLMPGLDGVQTLRRLREHVSDLRAIVYTGLPDFDPRVCEFLDMPFTAYVPKTIELKTLFAQIFRCAETRGETLPPSAPLRRRAFGTQQLPIVANDGRRIRQRLPCESITPAPSGCAALPARECGGGSIAGHVATRDQVVISLIEDLSISGALLVGDGLPEAGSEIALIVGVPFDLVFEGRVAWADPQQRRIGVEWLPAPALSEQKLGAALELLGAEAATNLAVALVLIDDVSNAALVCIALRRAGYLPRVARTPLAAIALMESLGQLVKVAVIAPHAAGMPGPNLHHFFADEYPHVSRIALAMETPLVAQLDRELAVIGRPRRVPAA